MFFDLLFVQREVVFRRRIVDFAFRVRGGQIITVVPFAYRAFFRFDFRGLWFWVCYGIVPVFQLVLNVVFHCFNVGPFFETVFVT